MANSSNLNKWVTELRNTLQNLANRDFGYELGTNQIREPTSQTLMIPDDLRPLYAICDGLSLPDIHSGYFIDSAQRVASASQRGEPTHIEGRNGFNIHVFGSDGGGGRFALRLDDGSVYYLPASGAVKDRVFYEDNIAIPIRVAETVTDFLWRLKIDVEAFIYDYPSHVYIAHVR